VSRRPRGHAHGRRRRAGFTFVELLVVITIIGILVLLAFVQLRATRGRAVEASMLNDLRAIRTAQELYLSQAGTYADALGPLNVRPSQGVTLVITEATDAGWAATAEHPAARRTRCAVFAGRVSAPPSPASEENVIACE
jgi:prepilin-type N-terminal cleavage/methylation domain-containing protein